MKKTDERKAISEIININKIIVDNEIDKHLQELKKCRKIIIPK